METKNNVKLRNNSSAKDLFMQLVKPGRRFIDFGKINYYRNDKYVIEFSEAFVLKVPIWIVSIICLNEDNKLISKAYTDKESAKKFIKLLR